MSAQASKSSNTYDCIQHGHFLSDEAILKSLKSLDNVIIVEGASSEWREEKSKWDDLLHLGPSRFFVILHLKDGIHHFTCMDIHLFDGKIQCNYFDSLEYNSYVDVTERLQTNYPKLVNSVKKKNIKFINSPPFQQRVECGACVVERYYSLYLGEPYSIDQVIERTQRRFKKLQPRPGYLVETPEQTTPNKKNEDIESPKLHKKATSTLHISHKLLSGKTETLHLDESTLDVDVPDATLAFFNKVKEELHDKPDTYTKFLQILIDYKATLDKGKVVQQINSLFKKDHDNLLLDFNNLYLHFSVAPVKKASNGGKSEDVDECREIWSSNCAANSELLCHETLQLNPGQPAFSPQREIKIQNTPTKTSRHLLKGTPETTKKMSQGQKKNADVASNQKKGSSDGSLLKRQVEKWKKKFCAEEFEKDKKLEKCVICRFALKQDVVQVNCPNECVVKMHRDCNDHWRRKNTHGRLECVYCSANIARTNRGVIPISTKNVTEAGPQTLRRRSSRVHVPFNARRDIPIYNTTDSAVKLW